MALYEDALAQSERHVQEGEACVNRQRQLARELERDGNTAEVAEARSILAMFEHTLVLMRDHLSIERRERGLDH